MKKETVILVMLGDASGVGAEIIVKTFADNSVLGDVKAVLLGDIRVLRRAEEVIGEKLNVKQVLPEDIRCSSEKLLAVDTANLDPDKVPFGVVSAKAGMAVIEDIRTACSFFAKGYVDGICFAPFNKQAIRLNLPEVASEQDLFRDSCIVEGLMPAEILGELNVVDGLWTTRVTSHIPMTHLGEYLSQDKILDMIRLADESCRKSGVSNPRIAVAALNPHCGEGGLCGIEEQTMILPAIDKAREEGLNVTGMFSADTVFVHAFKGEADVVVTMYHDQGQIALKLKSFSHAVTIEAGLPMPVGTPAHGTAHDIAGTGKVDPSAFISAFGIISRQSTDMEA